jgi:hypothetical protein
VYRHPDDAGLEEISFSPRREQKKKKKKANARGARNARQRADEMATQPPPSRRLIDTYKDFRICCQQRD